MIGDTVVDVVKIKAERGVLFVSEEHVKSWIFMFFSDSTSVCVVRQVRELGKLMIKTRVNLVFGK